MDWTHVENFQGLIALVVGYLSGSIPFGLLLTRWAGLGDVRKIGSGNIGATNVLRTGNKVIAGATLLLDILKATIPVLVFSLWGGEELGLVAAFGAFVGHLFPVWLRFRGGKGVATFIGVLFGLYWPLGLLFLAVWLVMAFALRRSSVSALAASLLSPAWADLLGRSELVIPLLILVIVIWIMHRENIGRLRRGEEPTIKLGRRA